MTLHAKQLAGRLKKVASKSKTIKKHNLGLAIGSIAVNQMQIVSIILNQIVWSPELPRWLIDAMLFVGKLFAFDFSSVISLTHAENSDQFISA